MSPVFAGQVKDNLVNLEFALTYVSQKHEITILLEQYPSVSKNISMENLNMPLGQIWEMISEEYDLEISKNKKCYVLQNKYNNITDVPNITPEELAFSFSLIKQGILLFTPKQQGSEKVKSRNTSSVVHKMYLNLKEHPVRRSEDGIVAVRDMSPPQRQLVHDFLVHRYLETAISWPDNLEDSLMGWRNSRLNFLTDTQNSVDEQRKRKDSWETRVPLGMYIKNLASWDMIQSGYERIYKKKELNNNTKNKHTISEIIEKR